MRKIKRTIVKHPKGKVVPKTVAGMLLERAEDFQCVLVMGLKRGEIKEEDLDHVDWSSLEFRDLCYFKCILDYEVNKRMAGE